MRENLAETVYAAEWPGFPGETEVRGQVRADIRALDNTFREPSEPDWLTMTEAFKAEEAETARELEASPIYDYEVEMEKPVPPLEKPTLRQRVKTIMGRAGEAVRETSISAAVTLQAKVEDTAGPDRRRKLAAAVAGAVVLGGIAYMEHKGVHSGPMKELHQVAPAAPVPKAHHHEHIRQAAEFTKLHTGDNPWTVTEDQLHAHGVAHPSDVRIAADDARLLKLNHVSTLQAMKLHVGDKLKLLKNW